MTRIGESVIPGPRNSLTDVPGIAVGNAQDEKVRSGVTVILPQEGAVAAVDVRGGAPGTRETDLLNPDCLVDRIDALVLAGGSAHGLDAAGAVMTELAAMGRGFEAAGHRIPIVPSAILFDLANGGDKAWGKTPPYRDLGRRALDVAGTDFAIGNAGAGYGATAGSLKGGLGTASFLDQETGITVAALAAVNSVGATLMPVSSEDGGMAFWAWPYEQGNEFGGLVPPREVPPFDLKIPRLEMGTNTTLVVVATDAELDSASARRLAIMAQDGIALAIRPAHTPYDGDAVFALSTGRVALEDPPNGLIRLGMMATACVARAIARGVYAAETLGSIPACRDFLKRG